MRPKSERIEPPTDASSPKKPKRTEQVASLPGSSFLLLAPASEAASRKALAVDSGHHRAPEPQNLLPEVGSGRVGSVSPWENKKAFLVLILLLPRQLEFLLVCTT